MQGVKEECREEAVGSALLTIRHARIATNWGHFARVCRGRQVQQKATSTTAGQTSANTIRFGSQDKETEQIQMYNIGSS